MAIFGEVRVIKPTAPIKKAVTKRRPVGSVIKYTVGSGGAGSTTPTTVFSWS